MEMEREGVGTTRSRRKKASKEVCVTSGASIVIKNVLPSSNQFANINKLIICISGALNDRSQTMYSKKLSEAGITGNRGLVGEINEKLHITW